MHLMIVKHVILRAATPKYLLNVLPAIRQIIILLQTPVILHLILPQTVKNAIPLTRDGNRHHTGIMIQDPFRFIQADTTESGIIVLIVIKIRIIMLILHVLTAMPTAIKTVLIMTMME